MKPKKWVAQRSQRAAELLEFAEAALDAITGSIGSGIVLDEQLARAV
jgi:hypothetical protein